MRYIRWPSARWVVSTNSAPAALDAHDRLVCVDLQIELQNDRAEIRQVFLARAFGLIGRLQRHAGDGDALVRAEESRLGRNQEIV